MDIWNGGGVGEGDAAGACSFAGASFAGVVAGAWAGAAGGFTGADDAGGGGGGVLLLEELAAVVSLPTALRTAATNGSAGCGVGTDPVRMVLKSTMRP